MSVRDIRTEFLELTELFPDGNAPGGMLEIVGASFVADEPAIFGTPNDDYIARELAWYERRSGTIRDLVPTPAIWEQVAGEGGVINSHYGVLMFGARNGSQAAKVLAELRRDPASRRAVAIYTNPGMHEQAVAQGKNDFVCTNTVQYLLRDGELSTVVQMRSNDVVFGYRNDYAWQRHVSSFLAAQLGVPLGETVWQAGSLHVYPRHRHLVK